MATHAYCSGCMRMQLVDAHWLALWIDSDGDLRISEPERGCDIDYERPDTVFACGQGSALALTERYLHHGRFAVYDVSSAMQGHACTAHNRTTL